MTRAEARLLADRLEAAERERDEADQAHAHWLNAAVELETRAEAAEARVERLEAALRGLDAPIAWITDFYPKAMVQMPGEHFAKIRAARSVLLHPEEEEKPK